MRSFFRCAMRALLPVLAAGSLTAAEPPPSAGPTEIAVEIPEELQGAEAFFGSMQDYFRKLEKQAGKPIAAHLPHDEAGLWRFYREHYAAAHFALWWQSLSWMMRGAVQDRFKAEHGDRIADHPELRAFMEVKTEGKAFSPDGFAVHSTCAAPGGVWLWLVMPGTRRCEHRIVFLDFRTGSLRLAARGAGPRPDLMEQNAWRVCHEMRKHGKWRWGCGLFSAEGDQAAGVIDGRLFVFDLKAGTMRQLEDLPYRPMGAALLNGRLYVQMEGGETTPHHSLHRALMGCDLRGEARKMLYDSADEEPTGALHRKHVTMELEGMIPNPACGTLCFLVGSRLCEYDPEHDRVTREFEHMGYMTPETVVQDGRCYFEGYDLGRRVYAAYELAEGRFDDHLFVLEEADRTFGEEWRQRLSYRYLMRGAPLKMPRGGAIWNREGLMLFNAEPLFFFRSDAPSKSPLWYSLQSFDFRNQDVAFTYLDPDGRSFWMIPSSGEIQKLIPP